VLVRLDYAECDRLKTRCVDQNREFHAFNRRVIQLLGFAFFSALRGSKDHVLAEYGNRARLRKPLEPAVIQQRWLPEKWPRSRKGRAK
jgi:hypothetical protein